MHTELIAQVLTVSLFDCGHCAERRPVPGSFKFNAEERKLILKTEYTKVVSVDSIQLANSDTRIRQIINYKRPEDPDEELSNVMLAGFGVETRVQGGNRFVD
mmetsp:Transcript_28766/g.112183  ORF Transcript_28766/g.112183 Transcript_28766/m.112183 type:complete len:102 (-) Transcript_28766:238-543(-)